MSDYHGHEVAVPSAADMSVDQGLRKFLLGIYNKLGLGLLVAAAVAYFGSTTPAFMEAMYNIEGGQFRGYSPLGWIVGLAPLGLILISNFFMRSLAGAMFIYWAIVALIGASSAIYLAVYTGPLIAIALLATAVSFGGLSLIGYITKRNLGPMGNFMGMAMWGLVISALIIPFLGGVSPMFLMIMCGIGILLTAGLIAATTQGMKMAYYATLGDEEAQKIVSYDAALSLFIQFVNLFRFILMIIGMRR